jgi:trypsin
VWSNCRKNVLECINPILINLQIVSSKLTQVQHLNISHTMKAQFLTALLLGTTAASSSQAKNKLRGTKQDAPDVSTVELPEQRIVGGELAAPGAYPSYAIPDFSDGLCGATLIHSDILISAAHCEGVFVGNNIYIGGNQLSGSDAVETLFATAERIHPSFNNPIQFSNDVMLIKLSQASQAPLVLLNTNANIPADSESVKIIGFGTTQEDGSVSDDLREVNVNVVDFLTCNSNYDGQIDDNSMICAAAIGKDSCQGDSGGPLLNQQGTLIGTVSFGEGCAKEGKPGIYSRISSLMDFISQGICELSSYPPASCGNTTATDVPTETAFPGPTIGPTTGDVITEPPNEYWPIETIEPTTADSTGCTYDYLSGDVPNTDDWLYCSYEELFGPSTIEPTTGDFWYWGTDPPTADPWPTDPPIDDPGTIAPTTWEPTGQDWYDMWVYQMFFRNSRGSTGRTFAPLSSSTNNKCEVCSSSKGFMTVTGERMHAEISPGQCEEACVVAPTKSRWEAAGWKCGPCPD